MFQKPKILLFHENKTFFFFFKSYAGKVEGELEISLPENLRALYMVPFLASEAAKVLRPQCYCITNKIKSQVVK